MVGLDAVLVSLDFILVSLDAVLVSLYTDPSVCLVTGQSA